MRRRIKYYRLIWLKHDLPAGLSVFFVALPLCLGIALASGAPLVSGLLSGIIGGVIVSFISGSQLGVSGPAAGLTTLVAASILNLGFEIFLLSVIVAGLFQIALGVFKLGGIANYFPSAVIKGMLAAIGIILISKQIPIALGYDQPDFWSSGFVSLFTNKNSFTNIENFNHHITRGSILISIAGIIVLFLFQQPFAKKMKIIPAPLIVVLISILINIIFSNFSTGFSLKQTQLVNIPDHLFTAIRFPEFSKMFSTAEIWKDGLMIGMLATLETLLCVEAIDKLDKFNRVTPVNRELIAQGFGNICCGLVGAIPMTAVIVRGAANVDAGGRTKLSSFTHGILLLVSILLIPFLLRMIPYAALSAILLVTGYNLTKPKLYKNMWSLGPVQFLPFIITIVIILSTDLLIGVSIGLLISVYYIIQNNFKDDFKIIKTLQHETEVYNIILHSNVTFLNKVKLRSALDNIPEYSILTIDGSDAHFIDHDILEVISAFVNTAHNRHIEMHLKNVKQVNVLAIH